MHVSRWLAVALCASLVGGCTPRKVRQARKLEGRYHTGIPNPAVWASVDPGGADRAWYSEPLRASIYTDSNCGPRFLDSQPSLLLEHLMHGLEDHEEITNQPRQVARRTGRLCVRQGTLDGVPVRVGAVVFNRGACTYDLVYIAPPDGFTHGWDDFEAVVDGFQPTGGELD